MSRMDNHLSSDFFASSLENHWFCVLIGLPLEGWSPRVVLRQVAGWSSEVLSGESEVAPMPAEPNEIRLCGFRIQRPLSGRGCRCRSRGNGRAGSGGGDSGCDARGQLPRHRGR